MKIDKNTIDKLCAMPDDKLWSTVKFFASANGINLSSKRMTQRDISRLREALSTVTQKDIERCEELINVYKYGGGYGRR